jgi:CRISPR system Cascade subunit CasA
MAPAKKEHIPKHFNLIDEKWIPLAGRGPASLEEVFTDTSIRSLGGSPVQRIGILKLLLAISQAAGTPKNAADWKNLGPQGLAAKALGYLKKRHGDFWLYGDKPFLQIPLIKTAEKQPFGAVMPDISTGNTTVLTQSQQERDMTDAEKALLVVELMGMALGGKKTDNSVVLSRGYKEKTNKKGKDSTGKPGTSLGFLGYLHHFLTGKTLLETLWFNLLSKEDIESLGVFTQGLGPIPWETPPAGENDPTAKALKNSLMGRLVPLSRFVLLADDGVHYSEGILHPNHLDGVIDPSAAMDRSGKTIKVLWTDPSRRPWRNLSSLLGFLQHGEHYFDCPYVQLGINRILNNLKKPPLIGIWAGGLRVSSNAGEQYVSGTDDYVESEIFFDSPLVGEYLYENLKKEMNILDELSRVLYGRVSGYYRSLKVEGENFARQAGELYWQLCERRYQELCNACNCEGGKEAEKLRPYFLQCVRKSYEDLCPRDTARQLNAWTENYPNLAKYAAVKEKTAEAVNL